MYCFRCGRKLPGREINCPDCDTPQKKRSRRHKRMLLGLFIFLSGAFVGSLFDTYIFKGEVWKHSFLNEFFVSNKDNNNSNAGIIASDTNASPSIEVKMQYDNNSISLYSEKEYTEDATPVPENFTSSTKEESKDEVPNENIDFKINKDNVEEITDTSILVSNPNSDSSITNTEETKSEERITASTTPLAVTASSTPLVADSSIATESIIQVDSPKNKADEVEIVEEYENGHSEVLEPVSETASNTDDTAIPDSDLFPRGNLVYKNVSLLELSDRNSYHGFMARKGKELIFASDRLDYKGKPTFQCFIKTPDEKAVAKRVFEWNGNVWTPELTPDSNFIVFSSDSVSPEHIFLYDRKSKHSMTLTSGSSKNMMPSISPDGKKIAFVSNRGDGKNRIYIIENFLGKASIKQVTKGVVNDREPRWTADGKSIIFTRIIENMKVSHIMKVSVDPIGEPVALVSANSRNWMADLSPDGKILAFTRSLNAGGSKNVIVLQDMKTGKEEVLNFPGIYESFRPVWNSDCSGFVFHVTKKQGKSIYQANFSRE